MKISKAAAYSLHALMYMVRHLTQLPVTTNTIAKAEGIPQRYLAKIFQQLVKAGFVKTTKTKNKGYVFAKPPEEITILEVIEIVEGKFLFDDCFLKHCQCGGTPDNCCIYAGWLEATRNIRQMLAGTSIADATWNHPQHRFCSLSKSLNNVEK